MEHIASAMINTAQLSDIPGMNQRDSENLSIALRRFKQLGKICNNIILMFYLAKNKCVTYCLINFIQ